MCGGVQTYMQAKKIHIHKIKLTFKKTYEVLVKTKNKENNSKKFAQTVAITAFIHFFDMY